MESLSAWESWEGEGAMKKEQAEWRKRVTKRAELHNAGNLIQMMWNFDNMEGRLIAGTQFDKGAI